MQILSDSPGVFDYGFRIALRETRFRYLSDHRDVSTTTGRRSHLSCRPRTGRSGDATHLLRPDLRRRPGMRERVEALLGVHEREAEFLKSLCRTRPSPRQTDHRSPKDRDIDRPLQAAAADRRRRLRRRLHGRAGGAGPPQGGAQDHQAGHGHQRSRRPLRSGTTGPGADGSSQHRQECSTPGRPRVGRPYFVMELVKGIPITEYCDKNNSVDRQATRAVHRRLPGRSARPPKGSHPPRPQTVEHAGHAARRPARAQGDRLRCLQGDQPAADRKDAVHRLRPDDRHAAST